MFEVRRSVWALAALATCAFALVLAGCGDSDDGDSDDSGSSEGANVADAEAALESYKEGVFEEPPTDAPTPQPGKNVWIVTYGLAATPAADFDRGAQDAAEVMGWETTSCDGKFSPNQWQACYRQAIADNADGLAIYTNDCASTRQALQEARDAGILISTAEAADCDDQEEGAQPLFDAQLEFAQGSYADWLGSLLEPSAAFVAIDGGEGSKVILLNEAGNFAIEENMSPAFEEHLERFCPSCEIVETVDYTGDDFGAPLQEKVAQALLQNPDAEYVVAPYDDPALNAVPAVREAGREGEVKVTGGIGIDPALELAHDGQLAGLYAQEIAWEGWGAMDNLNRLFNGEDPVPQGQGIGWLDETNLPPEGESYESPIDYEAIYRASLGGGGSEGN
jgi:ribose transport system substrate-binding protein